MKKRPLSGHFPTLLQAWEQQRGKPPVQAYMLKGEPQPYVQPLEQAAPDEGEVLALPQNTPLDQVEEVEKVQELHQTQAVQETAPQVTPMVEPATAPELAQTVTPTIAQAEAPPLVQEVVQEIVQEVAQVAQVVAEAAPPQVEQVQALAPEQRIAEAEPLPVQEPVQQPIISDYEEILFAKLSQQRKQQNPADDEEIEKAIDDFTRKVQAEMRKQP